MSAAVLAAVAAGLLPMLLAGTALADTVPTGGSLPAEHAGAVTGPEGAAGFTSPVPAGDGLPEVRHGFDPPEQPWLSGHRGVDLPAPVGTVIQAAGPGEVVFAGMVAGRPVVSVEHATGLRTTYEPVEPTVAAGDQISGGEQIGTLTATQSHCADSCLHWGARIAPQNYINPLLLLREEVQIRLYPIQG